MPSLVVYRCSVCRKHLSTEDDGLFSGIGPPLIRCHNCDCVNLRSKSRYKWDLTTTYRRFENYFGAVMFGALIGAGLGLVIASLVEKYLQWPSSLAPWLFSGAVAGLWYFWRELQNSIRESRARLSDQNYVSELRQFGFLK
jgi:hypothetical protein